MRLNALINLADNGGNKIDKQGIAPSFRWGIGTADEFSVGLYHLQYKNGINYGFRGSRTRSAAAFKPGRLLRRRQRLHGRRHDLRHRQPRASLLGGERAEDGDAARPLRTRPACQRDPLRRHRPGDPREPAAHDAQRQHGADARLAEQDPGHGQRHAAERLQRQVRLVRPQARRARRCRPRGRRLHALCRRDTGRRDDPGQADDDDRHAGRDRQRRRRRARRAPQPDLRRQGDRPVCAGPDPDRAGLEAARRSALGPVRGRLPHLRDGQPRRDQQQHDPARHPDCAARPQGFAVEQALRGAVPADRTAVLSPVLWHLVQHLRRRLLVRPQGSNTPPEASRNIELGGSVDWAQGRFTTRFAVFHATKYNERNTDQDTVSPDNYILSGQRHAAGIDLDFSGRITPAWELFAAYEFIPDAEVDKGTLPGGEDGRQPPGDDAQALGHGLDDLQADVEVAHRRRPHGAQRDAAAAGEFLCTQVHQRGPDGRVRQRQLAFKLNVTT